MTLLSKRRRTRPSVDRQAVTETELLRLWILSMPAARRIKQTNGKR
jgi:hypothetical protein